MNRKQVLEALAAHHEEFSEFDVATLAIFGSVARGEERPDSDVDILVEFKRPVGLFLFVRLQRRLEAIVGRRVDLVTLDAVRPEFRDRVEAEALRAA